MTDSLIELRTGDVAWAYFGEGHHREQGGRRPVVIVASDLYLDVVDSLTMIVPVTSRERFWPNHVPLSGPTGLAVPSWAVTEQLSTVSRSRIDRIVGHVDTACLVRIRIYLRDFLDL